MVRAPAPSPFLDSSSHVVSKPTSRIRHQCSDRQKRLCFENSGLANPSAFLSCVAAGSGSWLGRHVRISSRVAASLLFAVDERCRRGRQMRILIIRRVRSVCRDKEDRQACVDVLSTDWLCETNEARSRIVVVTRRTDIEERVCMHRTYIVVSRTASTSNTGRPCASGLQRPVARVPCGTRVRSRSDKSPKVSTNLGEKAWVSLWVIAIVRFA